MRLNKKDNREALTPIPVPEEKYLDVSATMQGSLRFDDPVNLRINGKFEGTLDTKGKLTIGSKAEIKANITGETIIIDGNVTGNIKASELLKLGSGSKLRGDVETPKIEIAEGAFLNGQLRMEAPQTNISVSTFAGGENIMDTFEVAKYLEVNYKKIGEWADSGVLPGIRRNEGWVFEKGKIDEWISKGKIAA